MHHPATDLKEGSAPDEAAWGEVSPPAVLSPREPAQREKGEQPWRSPRPLFSRAPTATPPGGTNSFSRFGALVSVLAGHKDELGCRKHHPQQK